MMMSLFCYILVDRIDANNLINEAGELLGGIKNGRYIHPEREKNAVQVFDVAKKDVGRG